MTPENAEVSRELSRLFARRIVSIVLAGISVLLHEYLRTKENHKILPIDQALWRFLLRFRSDVLPEVDGLCPLMLGRQKNAFLGRLRAQAVVRLRRAMGATGAGAARA